MCNSFIKILKIKTVKFGVIVFILVGVLPLTLSYASENDIKLFQNRYKTIRHLVINDKEITCTAGSIWALMSKKTKSSYLNGFFDGIISNQYRCEGIRRNKTTFAATDLEGFADPEKIVNIVEHIDQSYNANEEYYTPIHDILLMSSFVYNAKKDLQNPKIVKEYQKKLNRIANNPEIDAEFEKILKDIKEHELENKKKVKEFRIERKKYAEKFSLETGIEKIDPSDGFYWEKLTEKEKCSYIIGILDSVMASDSICLNKSLKDYKETYFKFYYHIKKINDMIDALDIVFREVAYRKLTTSFVLMVENGRASGMISREDATKVYNLSLKE